MDPILKQELQGIIAREIRADFRITHTESVGGGCINTAYRVSEGDDSYFVKINDSTKLPNFQAEYAALHQIAATDTLCVPQPLFVGTVAGTAVLIMEYLSLTSPHGGDAWRQMGAGLARLHATPIPQINSALRRRNASPATLLPEGHFGGTIANSTLGNQPGFLGTNTDWARFFCRHRLEFQFQQARRIHGVRFPREERLLSAAQERISHRPAPALTHGDLWGGNAAFALLPARSDHPRANPRSDPRIVTPVVFDPAPYIADPETDLALTELFGGFPTSFYDGYQRVRPIDSGYRERRSTYNLYHVLNHYNLFGGGYRRQAEEMMAEIVSEIH